MRLVAFVHLSVCSDLCAFLLTSLMNVCVSVIRGLLRIISQMRSISFEFYRKYVFVGEILVTNEFLFQDTDLI